MLFSNIAADEEGDRYVCKKLFGKDEIIPDLYSQKLCNYYLVNLRGPWKSGFYSKWTKRASTLVF